MEDEEIKKMQEKIEELEKQVKNNDSSKKIELGNNTYNLSNKYVNYKIIMGVIGAIFGIVFVIWFMVQWSNSQRQFNKSWNRSQESFNKSWNQNQKEFNHFNKY